MIEKRFILTDTGYIYDTHDKAICPTIESVVKVLNDQHEENQYLKKKLEFFYELNKPHGSIIEENKRLKSFISKLTNDCGEIVLMNGIGYNVKKIFGDKE